MITPSLSEKLNNAADIIALCIALIFAIHLAAGLLIILSAIGKALFFGAIEFWIFFYDFFANGLEFPELPELPR